MKNSTDIGEFLTPYDNQVLTKTLIIRSILFDTLPNVKEQVDYNAKMIAYCYGQKYTELVCTIIPSQKGLKLGFYKGAELPDPKNLLKGSGKISRYIEVGLSKDIDEEEIKWLVGEAYEAYKRRNNV